MIRVEVDGVLRDEGTIVMLTGREIDRMDPESDETIPGGEPGRPVIVMADHRMAGHIIEAIAESGASVIAGAEEWQVWADWRGRRET